jgi:hypothetical protein
MINNSPTRAISSKFPKKNLRSGIHGELTGYGRVDGNGSEKEKADS